MRRKTLCFAALILCFTSVLAAAAIIEVFPTGTAADFENVRAALASASPGDTVLLRAGTFNWSGNSAIVPPFVVPVGLPIPVSGITITGETAHNGTPLTIIAGPVGSDGFPDVIPGGPFNGGFINGPGVTGVTIRNLILRNFYQAIGLLQGPFGPDSYTAAYAPGADFSAGASDFVIENLRIENSTSGIAALGANNHLIVRNNTIQIVAKDGVSDVDSLAFIVNANAINTISAFPDIPDAPVGVVIEDNTVVGPGPYPQFLLLNGSPFWAFTVGIGIQGANGARVEGNTVSGFSSGLHLSAEGTVLIQHNSQSNGQSGMSLNDLSPASACIDPPAGAGGVPSSATNGAVVRNNRFTGNVHLPKPPESNYWLTNDGFGMLVSADNTQFVGNNVEGNEVAGIRLTQDSCLNPVRPNRTATGNLILGNHNVVMGTDYVLTHNTISGSKTSLQNVGEAIGDLPPDQRPPRKMQ
ncbi:MAG: right-handed parallel beta-helix repeat-containing protein [Acidobacteriia bacterium]|nr:right-handed parallel beta-helix repeat-containing protein [Terriglobia bacterium]